MSAPPIKMSVLKPSPPPINNPNDGDVDEAPVTASPVDEAARPVSPFTALSQADNRPSHALLRSTLADVDCALVV